MMRALYTAASGMQAQQDSIDIIANNLANVESTGYKKQRLEFKDMLYSQIQQPGQVTEDGQTPGGMMVGMGVKTAGTQTIFGGSSSYKATNNPMDVAIKGDGFFKVYRKDGTTAYTRDGAFRVNDQGELVTSTDDKLGIKIPKDASNITIDKSGVITATLAGKDRPQVIGQLNLVKFLNPQGLVNLGSNLYRKTPSCGSEMEGNPGTSGFGEVQQGYLEKSNVNVVEEMISIVQAQRAYEMSSKGIKAAEEMQRLASQLQRG